MKENVIKSKSYNLAVRVVKLGQFLMGEKKEFCLSKQILRNGTSIGANVEEANAGQSKKDFIAKMSISLKESRETHYWLRLQSDCGYLDTPFFESLLKDCEEIIVILTSILNTERISK